MSKVRIRKGERTLSELRDEEKWNLLKDYCSGDKDNGTLASEYRISNYAVDSFITTVYQKLQNVREIRMLLGTSYNPALSKIMVEKYVDCEHVNKAFLEKLSGPEEALTDHELLFCEFLVEYGEDEKAIQKAKLDVGLKKGDYSTYKDACKLRAFYLKKKPNIASYIQKIRQANLGVLENYGKEYIQSHLISIIEQLGNIGDKSSLTHQLKALESLARTVGAFEDKVTVETANGDDALDRLIAKAKKAYDARGEEEETEEENGEEGLPKMVAYVDGQEIYEPSP